MSNAPTKTAVIELLGMARDQEHATAANLTVDEREAVGTWEHWSAKDTLSQIAFWKHLQTGKLQAAQRGEPLPEWTSAEAVDPLNIANYVTWQRRPWAEVSAEAERAYVALVAQVTRMSEDELADEHRAGGALWPETLGNGIWYPFTELIRLYDRRDDAASKARIQAAQGAASERLLTALQSSAHISAHTRANTLYNTACWYALAGATERPIALLGEAFPLWRGLMVLAREDSDLNTLRGLPAFEALFAGYTDESAGQLITRDDLRARQAADADAPLLVDVRGPEEYAAGHIAGARNIPLDALGGHLDELPRDRLVVTYCNHRHRGVARCEQAVELLRDNGFAARALDGGYPDWHAACLPVEAPVKAGE
ncbi:MAG: rhodanese-like domain-containing protein [Ktedonobacterales bacterium]